MRRRALISLLGGVAAAQSVLWTRAARAQPAVPVIGFLDSRSPDALTDRLSGFRDGLKQAGYVESENLTIIYRWAENQMARLPALADELVHRPVVVLVTSGGLAVTQAAKAVTATTPIVFIAGEDPVGLGLVSSIARPGANLTGVNFLTGELATKRLELLRDLVPAAKRIAVLVNPANPRNTEATLRDTEPAARGMGLQVLYVRAANAGEIEAAFATIGQERPDAIFVGNDPFFNARHVQLAVLAAHQAVPAVYSDREFAKAGGLMSYGSDVTDAYRQMGAYVGRILKGAKPADLPVMQPSKFELVINAWSARMLGLTVPPTLLATADELIE